MAQIVLLTEENERLRSFSEEEKEKCVTVQNDFKSLQRIVAKLRRNLVWFKEEAESKDDQIGALRVSRW